MGSPLRTTMIYSQQKVLYSIILIISSKLKLNTLICLFIVIQNNVMKYITRIGQNTGILKASTKVQQKAIKVLLVTDSQNLNSGNRLMNGLNSSLALVGNAGPFSSSVGKIIKIN